VDRRADRRRESCRWPACSARAPRPQSAAQPDRDDPFYAIKDIRGWWESEHHARVDAVPTGPVTPWVPRGKPIWFTEYGFPSVNGAANQPNVFIDPKSSESFALYYSNRSVDRVQQRRHRGDRGVLGRPGE